MIDKLFPVKRPTQPILSQILSNKDYELFELALDKAEKYKWERVKGIQSNIKDELARDILEWLRYYNGATDLNFSNYIDTLCIPDGCYDFNMYDSYGDGWQGGGYNLIDSINNIISSGGLQGAYYFGFNSFSVNQGNQCPVIGCTEINSHNYNPLATIDDGSCQVISDNVELLYNWQGDSLPVSSIGGPVSYTHLTLPTKA